jgi:tetratricopeptide (TPR) repeat protein
LYVKKVEENPIKYQPLLAKAHANLGEIYSLQNKFDLSKISYNKALELYSKIEDNRYLPNKAKSLYSLGIINMEINNYVKSKKYFLMALVLYKNFLIKSRDKYLPNLGRVLNNLATLSTLLNNKEMSKKYNLEAYKIFQELDNKNKIGYKYILHKIELQLKLDALEEQQLSKKIENKKKSLFTQKGWVYLGEYNDKIWITQHFKFQKDIFPFALVNTYLISKSNLNIRKKAYFGNIKDSLDIGKKVRVLKVESIGAYKWAYIKY